MIWGQTNMGCYVHTREVARGNGAVNYFCWVGMVEDERFAEEEKEQEQNRSSSSPKQSF
jgi:hypothetical protein